MASEIGSAAFNATVAEVVLETGTPWISAVNASFVLTSGYVSCPDLLPALGGVFNNLLCHQGLPSVQCISCLHNRSQTL